MKMSTEEAPRKDMVKKVKKQKKDKIPEMKTENIIKTEKVLVETPDNNDIKKKKKKRKLTTEPDNVTDAYVGEVSRKKIAHTDSADNLQEQPVRDKKKKKKNKSMQTEPNIEMVKIEDVEDNNAQQDMKMTSKKANKVKNKTVANTEEKPEKTEKGKKKKKRLTNEDISDIKTVKAKKSKKDQSKLEENGIKIESSESGQIEDVNVKKKKRSLSVAKELEKTDSSQIKKKKHKKAKSKNEMDTVVDTKKMAQDFNVTQNKPKKKKKMAEESDKELLLVDEEAANISKLKKHSTQVESKVGVEANAGKKKKKKIKEEKEEQEEYPQVELVFLSEKAGNIDEVNVNKERRKALQMEIDQASQPEKPAKPLGLGQWSTAEFGSSERQQKFLRLMGGFKKEFEPASVSGGSGNMALGRDAQQELQRGLLGQFERAHSRRMDSNNKGAGLGFAAPSTKKFSIDKNAIRSIHFDD